MGIASIIISAISAISAIGFGIWQNVQNQKNVESTNAQNQSNLEEAWERDDSELQRRKNDALAAGFSPVAALGGSSGNTNPISLSAPEVDYSGVSESVGNFAQSLSQKRELDIMQKSANASNEKVKAETESIETQNLVDKATAKIKVLRQAAELQQLYLNNDLSAQSYVAGLMELKSAGLSDDYIETVLNNVSSNQNGAIRVTNVNDKIASNKLTDATISKLQADKNLTDDYHSLQATIAAEYNLKSNKDLRSALGDAQKLASEYEAKLKELDYNNQNATWTVEVPVMTDSGVARMQKLTGKPYEIIHKYAIYFDNYAHAKEDRDWINDPTESNEVLKSIKSFLDMFKGWL